MTPQELKESILWDAIQGKLTIQYENESADDVIGNLSLSHLSEEETYFDIPANWRWAKIGEIFDLVNGKAFKPTDWAEQGVPIVRIQNLNDPNAPYNYFSGEIEDKYMLQGGELLFSWSGTPGTSFGAFIWEGGVAVLNQHIFIVYPRIHLDHKYAKLALNGELRIFISKAHGGAGLKHITRKEFDSCVLPIPPLSEQKRIVAKIEELIPLIDRYEQAWSRLEDFNQRFPGDMQKSILQMAIQGKLVEQRPEEGTGEELYHQMQNEKQALIKAGRIKKEKPMPGITEDGKPFDIPESWMWVRLGTLTELITSGSRDWAQYYAESGDVFLRMGNLSRDSFKLRLDKIQHVLLPEHTEGQRTVLQAGDLLFSITGEVGTLGLIPEGFGKAYINQHTAMIRFLVSARNRYIPYLLLTDYAHKYYNGNQHGIKNSFRLDTIAFMPIPLPPLAEQKRIVDKLEELLPLCKRLK